MEKEVAVIEIMAPAKRPSTMAKLKTRDSASLEAGSSCVTGSTPALAPVLATVQSTLKLATNVGDSEKCRDLFVDNAEAAEEEECQTPKSQEHKIPPLLCCPPAPQKRRSIPVKRKLRPAIPFEGFYIPSDSDLQFLFGPDLAKRKGLRKRPK